MRALLTLWWWQWVTSVHERLHRHVTPVRDTYRPESVYDAGDDLRMPNLSVTEITFDVSAPNSTVTYGSDDG